MAVKVKVTPRERVVCTIRPALYISDRRHCAYTLYEMLAERNPEKASEVWKELRECDKSYSADCYDALILKLEKLLNVRVAYKYKP